MPELFSSSRRIVLLATAVVIVVIAAVVVVVASTGSSSGSTVYYLALGDSLSAGIQPTPTGDSVVTDHGYVNDIYAHYRARYPHLKLVQMGCPGDDTQNVITGQGNTAAARLYHCDRADGSQLNAALAFIRAHRSQVKLITIDIGANDVNNCLNGTVFAEGTGATISCVNQGEQSIAANSPKILNALGQAADPGTVLVGGTLYDPFLAAILLKQTQYGAIATAVARASPALINKINSEIDDADADAGFKTADVADAFDTYDTTRAPSARLGGRYAKDLVVLCADTWACTPAPQGPNIHPNTDGYRLIAKAYLAVMPRGL